VSDTATNAYLREVFATIGDGYRDNCVVHACRLVELLLTDGERPWIGRVRDVTQEGDQVMHGPLIPVRLLGRRSPTWTTHYVACAGGRVYDPLVGEPIEVERFTAMVFGRELTVETFLDAEATARAAGEGSLRAAFRFDEHVLSGAKQFFELPK
jgi:hypothetical protein